VEEINSSLRRELPLDDILVCYHDEADGCDCRKPRPGLLLRAASRHGIDLGRSYVIGDRWRDIDAGAMAGCKTVWIDYQYDERAPLSPPAARVSSLREAVAWVLEDSMGSSHEERLRATNQAVR
jgi:D-glycero-D-manno-heptose 1,7-bisphosphate phosphatase